MQSSSTTNSRRPNKCGYLHRARDFKVGTEDLVSLIVLLVVQKSLYYATPLNVSRHVSELEVLTQDNLVNTLAELSGAGNVNVHALTQSLRFAVT